jgi:hypothetical protein
MVFQPGENCAKCPFFAADDRGLSDHILFDSEAEGMSSAYVTTNGLAKQLGVGRRCLDRLEKAGVLAYDLPNVKMFNLERAKLAYLGYMTRSLEGRNLL